MSSKFSFSDSERSYLEGLQAISVDSSGREVLAGLTFEETAWYLSHTHRILGRRRQRSDRLRYLELHDKHEKASVRTAAQ